MHSLIYDEGVQGFAVLQYWVIFYYNGVAFSRELLEWGPHAFSDFLG